MGDERFFTGRLLRALKNIFSTLVHHPASVFSVMFYYVRRGLRQYRRLGRYVALTSVPLALAVAVVVAAHHYASLCRAMRVEVGGVTVGYVTDDEEYKAARRIAVHMLSNALPEEEAEERLPQGDLVSELVTADGFTSADELAQKLVSLSDVSAAPACGVYVDGRFLCAVAFESDARAALLRLLSDNSPASPDGAVSFVENVTLEQGLYPEGMKLTTSEELYDKLKNAKKTDAFHLTMKQVKTEITNVDTDFDTVEIPTDTMYLGASRTVVNGVRGYDQITSLVTYVDGKKVSSTEVSRVTVAEPVTERVQVGTRALDEGYRVNSNSGGLLLWPAVGPDQINSDYEWRWGKLHAAIDIGSSGAASSYGKTIIAAAEGTVVVAGVHSSYGYYVRIDHGNGMETLYAHCMAGSLMVTPGMHVYAGQPIAKVGMTGYATGPHLHFEVIINGTRVDPKPYLGISR